MDDRDELPAEMETGRRRDTQAKVDEESPP
jgi:hypothetical protein